MRIELIKTQRFFFINYCPIIIDDDSDCCILVDPAWEKRKLMDYISDHGLQVRAILLTHHHLDHSHLANYFAKKYQCPVYMSSTEMEYYHYKCKNLQPIYPNQQVLTLDNFPSIILHHTPGHTIGGICYQVENALMTGDTLFNEGCGICYARGGDPGMMFDSLNYLKKVVANSVQIYPGHRFHHDLGQRFAEVKKMNIYLNIDDRDEFIRFRSRRTSGLLNFK